MTARIGLGVPGGALQRGDLSSKKDVEIRVEGVARAALSDILEPTPERASTWAVVLCPVVAVVALAVAVLVVTVGLVPGLCIQAYERLNPASCELRAEVKKFRHKIMHNQLKAMKEAVKGYRGEFVDRIQKASAKDIPAIREMLRRALQANPNNELLQELAFALKQAKVSFKPIGMYLSNTYAKEGSTLADKLEKIYDAYPAIKRESFMTLLWGCAHPGKAFGSFCSKGKLAPFGFGPLSYNGYLHGNIEHVGAKYLYEETSCLGLHAPGFGQDHSIDVAAARHCQRRDGTYTHHALENGENGPERARLAEQQRIAKGLGDRFTWMSSQMDGAAERGFGLADDEEFLGNYCDKLREAVAEEDLSFVEVTSDDVDTMHFVIKLCIDKNGEYWKGLSVKEKARVCLALLGTLAKLRTLKEALHHANPGGLHVHGEACKQGVDRAMIFNVLSHVLLAPANGKGVDEEALIGMVFTRALLVDERAVIYSRFRGLVDTLHMLQGVDLQRMALGFPGLRSKLL